MNTANSITIVGGGASGWMTALYLNKWYNDKNQSIAITVIESKDIGILGVGEATVHSLRHFFRILDLDENDLLHKTNGTLKAGILFRNWKKPIDGKTHEYFHPFEAQAQIGKRDIALSWLLSAQRDSTRFDESVSLSSYLINHLHSPKAANSAAYEGIIPYGYHIDATLMARYLRDKAVVRGVKHIEATVDSVVVDNGLIAAVNTDLGRFSADFFVDCTGFRSLLIDALRQDNWISYENALPCNKAFAIQTAYPREEAPKPYTVATALNHGWTWEIDLVNRRGNGYVYDGRRISSDQAEQELLQHLGAGAEVIRSAHLNMKIGRRKEFWVGNCVAIGLAAGFIEPLESTGLHLIDLGVRLLSTHSPSTYAAEAIKQSYNRLMNNFYENLKEFIVLHYCLTDRDDTAFWRDAAKTSDFCDGLNDKLALWRHKYCERMDMTGGQSVLFVEDNYRFILYGMGYYPTLDMPVDSQDAEQQFAQINYHAQLALQRTMSHRSFLKSLAMAN